MTVTPIHPNRKSAKEAGASFYLMATPCAHGHIAPRHTSSGSCTKCQSEWRKQDKERRFSSRNFTADGLPKTKAAAKEMGHKTYDTGKPCRHGHKSPRMASNGICCACRAEESARRSQKSQVKKKEPSYVNRDGISVEDRIQAAAKNPIEYCDLVAALPEYKETNIRRLVQKLQQERLLWKTSDGKLLSGVIIGDDNIPVFGMSRAMAWINRALASVRKGMMRDEKKYRNGAGGAIAGGVCG